MRPRDVDQLPAAVATTDPERSRRRGYVVLNMQSDGENVQRGETPERGMGFQGLFGEKLAKGGGAGDAVHRAGYGDRTKSSGMEEQVDKG